MRSPVTRSEAVAITAAVAHLRALADTAAPAYRAAVRPKTGSAEERAIRAARGNDAGLMAEMLLMSSDFYLLTFAAALSTREIYPLAGYALLRGAAEPAAWAAWLMDPAISKQERLARVLGERLYNLKQQHGFKDLENHASDRIGELVEDAKALGCKPHGKKPDHFGQERPSATRLFGKLLPDVNSPGADPMGADIYRWLSGYTHSVPWAIFAEGQALAGNPGFGWLRVEARPVVLVILLSNVLRLYEIAHIRLAGRIGEDARRWTQMVRVLPPPPDLRSLLAGL
jgi:hypothetical protein